MDRKELKKMIPHGGIKEIAQKAGVTPSAVQSYLKGRSNSVKIELATLEFVGELNAKRKILIEQIMG